MKTPSIATLLTALASVSVLSADFAWQKDYARVLPEGDLALAQEAWVAPQMTSPRYIDYVDGDDSRDGLSPATAWKHHPLDSEATGSAKANTGNPDGYVFKGGVAYRGRLKGSLKGSADRPIHLTSIPSWGRGKALLAGSEAVPARKWRRAAHPKMPEGEKVWAADLDFCPRTVFFRGPQGGAALPMKLAREPNWEVSNPEDVNSEWWSWEQPNWWTGQNKTTVNGKRMHLGIDTQHLHKYKAEDLVGGIVWSEWAIVMGLPYPSLIEAANPNNASIAFQGFWYNDSETLATNNRYYLEDRPIFLDQPGEFWFDRQGNGGTLYLRLPGDADPTQRSVMVEAGRRHYLVDLDTASNVRISNLAFAFTTPFWRLEAPFFESDDVLGSAIRVQGGQGQLTIDHCDFSDVLQAIRLKAGVNDAMDVAFNDNRIQRTDHSAINIEGDILAGEGTGRHNALGHVDILRNSLREIGRRCSRFTFTHALCVNWPETLHLAGNMLSRTYSAGIFVFMGKPDGDKDREVPFSRAIIHHNRVESALLSQNDWGAIETWQGGPYYVFNNISINPNGYWNWAAKHQDGSDRLGFAYYLDGSFKNYLFNNIALGHNNDLTSPLCNNAAFYQAVPSIYNHFFNNTAHRFATGSNWSPAGGRQIFAGNVFSDISKIVFSHGPQKEDTDENKADMPPFETIGYARNVFAETPPNAFGALEKGGDPGTISFDRFRAAAQASGTFASELGVITENPVFHEGSLVPHETSPVVDAGVRPFVPWNLGRTVGEWNFRAGKGLDEHWFMTRAYTSRSTYYKIPRNDLVMPADATATAGFTEDWVPTAVRFSSTPAHFPAPEQKFVLPGTGDQPANDGLQHFELGSWASVSTPREIPAGQPLKLGIDITNLPANAGNRLHVHLHWLKKDGWGGYLSHLYVPATIQGNGHYEVSVNVPNELPAAFDAFNIIVGVGPDTNLDNASPKNTFTVRSMPGPAAPPATATCGDKPQAVGSASLIVEAILATSQPDGSIVGFDDDMAGYRLDIDEQGRVVFVLKVRQAVAAAVSTRTITDGKPHHILAEADREAGKLTLYIDGKAAGSVPMTETLRKGDATSDGELLVGEDFKGELDFLRIAFSSLKESRTSIEELYAWQFDGPFLRDFGGNQPKGHRDAGAMEFLGNRPTTFRVMPEK